MNLYSQTRSTRSTCARRWMFAVVVALPLAGGALTASRPVVAAASVAAARTGDAVQRNRQYQHAEALYLSGHLKEASTAFEELSRAYPRDARVWLKYGNTLTKLGNYDDAAAAFQNAIELDPTQSGAALNLTLIRLAQAQGALDVALERLAVDSSGHTQAETLQRQIKVLLGAPNGSASSH
jgi:tetratricopeptide (TPR) repeat protein